MTSCMAPIHKKKFNVFMKMQFKKTSCASVIVSNSCLRYLGSSRGASLSISSVSLCQVQHIWVHVLVLRKHTFVDVQSGSSVERKREEEQVKRLEDQEEALLTRLQAERDALMALVLGALSPQQKKRLNAVLDEREAILNRRERKRVVAKEEEEEEEEKDEEVTEETDFDQLLSMMSQLFSLHCGDVEPLFWQSLVGVSLLSEGVQEFGFFWKSGSGKVYTFFISLVQRIQFMCQLRGFGFHTPRIRRSILVA